MGVSETREHIPCFVRWILKHPLADKDIQEADLRASGLPLVIVRPTGLNNKPARRLEHVTTVENGPVPTSQISRADVATFMLEQMHSDRWLGKAVGISWTIR